MKLLYDYGDKRVLHTAFISDKTMMRENTSNRNRVSIYKLTSSDLDKNLEYDVFENIDHAVFGTYITTISLN